MIITMRYPCVEFRHELGERVAVRNANGRLATREQCENCGRVTSYNVPGNQASAAKLPLREDYLGNNPACEPCTADGTEWHHFAPSSLFPDDHSRRHFGAYLCPECHAEWHQRTGLALL